MVDKKDATVHDKTHEFNKSEIYVLTHDRFNTYLFLIFSH